MRSHRWFDPRARRSFALGVAAFPPRLDGRRSVGGGAGRKRDHRCGSGRPARSRSRIDHARRPARAGRDARAIRVRNPSRRFAGEGSRGARRTPRAKSPAALCAPGRPFAAALRRVRPPDSSRFSRMTGIEEGAVEARPRRIVRVDAGSSAPAPGPDTRRSGRAVHARRHDRVVPRCATGGSSGPTTDGWARAVPARRPAQWSRACRIEATRSTRAETRLAMGRDRNMTFAVRGRFAPSTPPVPISAPYVSAIVRGPGRGSIEPPASAGRCSHRLPSGRLVTARTACRPGAIPAAHTGATGSAAGMPSPDPRSARGDRPEAREAGIHPPGGGAR